MSARPKTVQTSLSWNTPSHVFSSRKKGFWIIHLNKNTSSDSSLPHQPTISSGEKQSKKLFFELFLSASRCSHSTPTCLNTVLKLLLHHSEWTCYPPSRLPIRTLCYERLAIIHKLKTTTAHIPPSLTHSRRVRHTKLIFIQNSWLSECAQCTHKLRACFVEWCTHSLHWCTLMACSRFRKGGKMSLMGRGVWWCTRYVFVYSRVEAWINTLNGGSTWLKRWGGFRMFQFKSFCFFLFLRIVI